MVIAKADTTLSFAGVAEIAGSTLNDGARRIALTIMSRAALDGDTSVIVHELGHNHGRPHAPGCGADGPDSMYPYPAGDMGANGFSLSTKAFKPKSTFREIMSYCRPPWVGDYMYDKFEARVRTITAAKITAGGGMPLLDRSLQAFVGQGEKDPSWGIVDGALVSDIQPVTPQQYALLELDDGRQLKVPVAVAYLTDDQTREFAVNLPSDAEVTRAEVVVNGERYPVPVATLLGRGP